MRQCRFLEVLRMPVFAAIIQPIIFVRMKLNEVYVSGLFCQCWTSPSPSSLLIGCVLSWQVVEKGKLQTNICLLVWQASALKGWEPFRPSAGALQGAGRWGRETCGSFRLTSCTRLFSQQCDQNGKQAHQVTAFYRKVGHKLKGVKHNKDGEGNTADKCRRETTDWSVNELENVSEGAEKRQEIRRLQRDGLKQLSTKRSEFVGKTQRKMHYLTLPVCSSVNTFM